MRSLLFAASLFALALPSLALPNLAAAAPQPTVVPDANAPQGKLPAGVTPRNYRLDFTILPEKDRFSGHTEIDITFAGPTKSFYMHGRDLKVSKAVIVQNGSTMTVKYTQVDPLGVVRIDMPKTLTGPATLQFDYDAPFGDGPAGLYHIKVGDDWYAWTQFESIDARAAFPSFDEPGFKTPFTVTITTDPSYTVASNAPESGHTSSGKLMLHSFYQTKPLPTYLVALVTGPFVTAEGVAPPSPQRNYPLPIRVIATKPNKDKLQYALSETPSIVAHLENYFGQPFPFPKLDQIASPVMPGAMENAGADVYGDDILLLDPGATTAQKQEFGMVVSHELSHQWFGDYVTPAWWNDIWLNESFANWMGYRIGNEWRPELNIGVGAVDEGFGAMGQDALKVGRPIHQEITKNSDVDSAFDAVTYGKGGQVIAMIANYLGDERFKAGVRLHMSRHPYGNATSDDFFQALADAAQDPGVVDAMKSFVNQQGFPTVDFTHVGGYLVATQSRYARLGTTLDPETWTIPLCLRHGDAAQQCYLMAQTQGNLGVDQPGVLIPNAGGTGYYRFTLTPEDWDALIKTGATLPAGEGVATIDSLWGQFNQGKLDPAKLVDAARVFVNNKDSNVAVEMGDSLSAEFQSGIIPASAEGDFRRVMGEIYTPRLTALGFDPKAGVYLSEDPDQQKLRQELVDLVARDARDAAVRKTLDDAATAYLGGNTSALDQAFMRRAFRVHVENGGLAAAKDMYERALASQDELFRSAALSSVTAGATADTATWILGIANTDKRMRSSDKSVLLAGLFGQSATRDQAYDWLKANFEGLTAGNGIFMAGRMASLPGAYCSAQKADEVDQFMRPKVVASGRGELSFNRTLENMRNCDALKTAEADAFAAALKAAQ